VPDLRVKKLKLKKDIISLACGHIASGGTSLEAGSHCSISTVPGLRGDVELTSLQKGREGKGTVPEEPDKDAPRSPSGLLLPHLTNGDRNPDRQSDLPKDIGR
jgi:hypothetical protein